MYKSKALQLLNNFDNWEINHFKKFLGSPFFNKRQDVILLFEFIIKEKNSPSPDLTKQNAFAHIFPDQKWAEQNMYNLLSYLYKLMEQFLAVRAISNNKPLLKLYLGKAYREKRQKESFQRALKEGKQILEKQTLRDRAYMSQNYEIGLEYYDYIASKSGSPENNLQELADQFDVMYIAEKLKQFCFQVSHQRIFNKKYSSGFRQSILQLVEEHSELQNYPAIQIYYSCYQAATTEDEKYFQQFRNMILVHANRFTIGEMRDIHLMAINFCIKKMNTGKTKYIREAFELYRLGLEKEYLIENGELSKFTFMNIVFIGMKLEEYDWVEHFINIYRKNLARNIQQNIYQYLLATLRYEQKKYKEAMQLLITFDSNDYLMMLGAKFTLVKIYFELKEFEPLDALLESMRIYLRRKNLLSEYYRLYYRKIINLSKKLIRLQPGEKAKAKFKLEVKELQVPSVQKWFLDQIDG